MRDGAPDEVLAGYYGYRVEVASWLGSTLLASGLRPLSGSAVWSRLRDVKDSLTMEVPRIVAGRDWVPRTDPEHPLAARGQILEPVAIVKSSVTGFEYPTPLGRFRISKTTPTANGTVSVSAVGIEQRMVDESLVSPLTPRVGGTFVSEIRRLLPVGLAATFSPLLVDRACPTYIVHSGSRYKAIQALLEAWPAIARPNGDGQLQIVPPNPASPTPVMTLSQGERSLSNVMPTVVNAPLESSDADIYNRWIVKGTETDESSKVPVMEVVDQTTGPFAVDPERFGIRDNTVSSAAIVTSAQAIAVGEASRDASLRAASVVPVEAWIDPRRELDDAVLLRTEPNVAGGFDQEVAGYVEGLELPFRAGSLMRLDVAVVT